MTGFEILFLITLSFAQLSYLAFAGSKLRLRVSLKAIDLSWQKNAGW